MDQDEPTPRTKRLHVLMTVGYALLFRKEVHGGTADAAAVPHPALDAAFSLAKPCTPFKDHAYLCACSAGVSGGGNW